MVDITQDAPVARSPTAFERFRSLFGGSLTRGAPAALVLVPTAAALYLSFHSQRQSRRKLQDAKDAEDGLRAQVQELKAQLADADNIS